MMEPSHVCGKNEEKLNDMESEPVADPMSNTEDTKSELSKLDSPAAKIEGEESAKQSGNGVISSGNGDTGGKEAIQGESKNRALEDAALRLAMNPDSL